MDKNNKNNKFPKKCLKCSYYTENYWGRNDKKYDCYKSKDCPAYARDMFE